MLKLIASHTSLLQDCNNVEDRLNVRFGIHRIPEDSQWIRLTGSHYCLCNGSSYKLTVVVVARVKIIYVYPDRLQNHAVFQVEVLGYKAQDHAQRLRFLNGAYSVHPMACYHRHLTSAPFRSGWLLHILCVEHCTLPLYILHLLRFPGHRSATGLTRRCHDV